MKKKARVKGEARVGEIQGRYEEGGKNEREGQRQEREGGSGRKPRRRNEGGKKMG